MDVNVVAPRGYAQSPTLLTRIETARNALPATSTLTPRRAGPAGGVFQLRTLAFQAGLIHP
jgi:hypothetical protein